MRLLIFMLIVTSSNLYAQRHSSGISWFAAGDLISESNSESHLNSGAAIREVEISANSDIDEIWSGTVTLSIHQEVGIAGGGYTEVHEAFVYSENLITNGKVIFGKYFLGFGVLNRLHRHDWLVSYAPLYHQNFFGTESVRDLGMEYTNTHHNDIGIGITAGVATGNEFVHTHNHEGEAHEEFKSPHVPTHYLRLSHRPTNDLDYGLNFVGRTDGEGDKYTYLGFDLIFKTNSMTYQFETWSRKKEGHEETVNDLGSYLYIEKMFNERHSAGFRIENYKTDGHHEHEESNSEVHAEHYEVEDMFQGATASYIYNSSPKVRYRFNVSYEDGLVIDETETNNVKGFLQLIFSLGEHAGHDHSGH